MKSMISELKSRLELLRNKSQAPFHNLHSFKSRLKDPSVPFSQPFYLLFHSLSEDSLTAWEVEILSAQIQLVNESLNQKEIEKSILVLENETAMLKSHIQALKPIEVLQGPSSTKISEFSKNRWVLALMGGLLGFALAWLASFLFISIRRH